MYLGDVLDFLKTLPDDIIKLVISSPPYNIGKEYEEKKDFDEYLDFQRRVIVELKRVLTNDGSICWETGNIVWKGERSEIEPLDIAFYPIFKSLDFKLRNRIVWQFNSGLNCTYRYSGRHEMISWYTKSDDYQFNLDDVRVPQSVPNKRAWKGDNVGMLTSNPLGKNPGDYWEFIIDEWNKKVWKITNVKSGHPEKTEHPCQFPIELCERCVLAHSNPGDIVFDPFAGVGSTLLAAIIHDRKAFGVDKEKKYVDLTIDRVHDLLDGKLKYIRPKIKERYDKVI
jgi:adenine-specific DNA-methyltransferase